MVERKVGQKPHISTAMVRQVLKIVPVSSWWPILCEVVFEIQVALNVSVAQNIYKVYGQLKNMRFPGSCIFLVISSCNFM